MSDDREEPVMPPPKAGKPPLKVNIYWASQGANMQLLPMFPYDGPGDIVPCLVARRTHVGEDQGRFWHENSVDEVAISFGGNGMMRPGEVRVGAKTHGVGAGPSQAETFTVSCVTQRQSETGVQDEAVVFVCESCSEPVYRHEIDAFPEHDPAIVHPLATTDGSSFATLEWNASEAARTCKACGFVNPPFPEHFWGWHSYMDKTRIAAAAQRMLLEAGAK